MSKKTFTKRFKITKTGKIMRRKMGLSHFRSKKSPNAIRNKRNLSTLSSSDKRQIVADL